VNNWIRQLY